MKKFYSLFLLFLILSINQLWAQDGTASNNFKTAEGNLCNGKIYIELYRYRDNHGNNLTGERLYVDYKDSDGDWHHFFKIEWYVDDDGNHYPSTTYTGYDGASNYTEGTDNNRDYITAFYFNPDEVDNGALMGTQVEFRIAEEKHYGDAPDYFYFSAPSWKPNPPFNVRASKEEFCDEIELTWDPPTNLNGQTGTYRVYTESGTYLGNTSGTSYTHSGLGTEVSRSYKLRFRANCANYSDYSGIVTGSTKPYGEPPTAVVASDDQCDNTIKIDWQWMAENPSDFWVLRSTDSNFSYYTDQVFTVDGGDRSYEDVVPNANQTYYYQVWADDGCGNLRKSATAEGIARNVPAAATLSNLTQNNANFVLDWSQNGIDVTGYIIERITDEGTATFNVESGQYSYTDDNIAGCKTYTYKVRTKNACSQEGVVSTNSLSGKITPSIANTFEPAKELKASKGFYNDKIVLEWDYNYTSIIEKFDIYRKEYGSAESATKIATIDPTSSYVDESAQAGIYYEYSIQGRYTCENSEVYSTINAYSKDVGFRVPLATVSGNVTFESGTGVKGVSVIAETEDDFEANSLQFSGTATDYLTISDDNFEKFDLDTAFTFQTWIKPTSTAAGMIFQKGTQYKVERTATGEITFSAGGQDLTLSFTEKPDTFFCINAVRSADSLKLYVIYNQQTIYKTSALFTATTPTNTSDLILGQNLNGHMEEVRVWHKALSEDDIKNNSFRYIAGNESGLSAYYRFNEMFSSTVYDISRSTAKFNENHAAVIGNVSISQEVPFSAQLSVKGITDENGNYLITGIPYTVGSTYKFTPIYGAHEFDPTQRQLYIGPGSNVHSGIDFVDIAAFRVTGNVRYKDTYFPVKGANIYIDGEMVVQTNGVPVTTDNNGNYDIYVPIGWHNIQIAKMGHVFRDNGRFPAEGNWNFQEGFSGLDFVDTTLIKVVGKVTGGPIQAAKPIGLGKTENNIGHGTITLTTQKEFDLATAEIDSTWQNEMYEDDQMVSKGETGFFISGTNPKDITVYPDPVTGEFFAYLLPEKYIITSITAGNYTYDPSFHTTVDLTNKFRSYTEIDSVVVNATISPQGDSVFYYQIDSVQYNHDLDLIYREVPSVSVSNKDGENAFWESEIEAKNGDLISITNPDGTPKTAYPVFLQRGKYDLKISVFEKYVNADDGNAEDLVPVNDGKIEIQNALAINKNKISLPLNYKGETRYTFKGGLPNITTGGIGDYLKTMAIVAKTGKNNAISTPWQPGGETFKAYLLGGMPTGNNFVTTGPKKIGMILRDPPGSNSYAYLEKGHSISTTTSTNFSTEATVNQNLTVDMGMKTITFVGLGAGVITETEVINNAEVGVEIREKFIEKNTTTTTVSNTQTWSTSTDEDYVGTSGDLLMGYATNIIYGVSTQIELMPTDMPEGTDFTGNSFEQDGVTYDIGMTKGIRVSPEIGTMFQYSINHLENYLIPNLKMLRNNYLINHTDIYQCVVCDQNDENFGAPNTTGQMTENGWTGGDSYNFTIPAGWPADSMFIDSVQFYNRQIKNWEDILAFNEKEKLQAETHQNFSFDAGTIYENSVTTENSEESSFEFEFEVSPRVALEVGAEVFDVGLTYKMETTMSTEYTEESGETETNTITYGYVLNDGNAGDYFSIDIKKTPSPHGPVFAVRGGQSMCPYEGSDLTKYYQPGSVLNEATMQREVPQITCENPIQVDVPEDRPALYNVQIANTSETGDDQWMTVSIDDAANPDGILVKMDGAGIGGGRMLLIPAGETINKTITLHKVKPDVYDYEDIGLILHSNCQFDPTDFQDDIADTVRLSAYFQPVCTGVSLNNLDDQWVVNTNGDTTLNLAVEDYDLSHSTFEKILFQYKSTSTSTWATDMIFYVDEDDYNAASDPKTYINGQNSLPYTFNLEDLQDRNYDLRLTSMCSDGTENNSYVISGIKDVKRPQIFGSPQPADGILSPNDEIMLTFNEQIYEGGILPYNFSVRGVLNGNEIKHQSCLYFDGSSDYASVVSGVNLDNKSWTIEFWARRGDLTQGVILAQNGVEVGFDDTDHFYLKTGTQTITSNQTFTDLETWYHFAVTYDIEAQVFNMFVTDNIERESVPQTSPFAGNGRMYLGKPAESGSFFNGFVHELRIWEQALGFGTIYSQMYQVLIGNEIGLGGYWPMDEARGDKAQDKSRNHHALLFGAEWRVFPTGYARTFDGDAYININTGSSVVISDKMDFTLEMYFKGQPQANTVLFSNGKGDGTNVSPPYENIWLIGTNANGEIYAKNNGVNITITEEDFFDDRWHHLALVMNRQANASLYIDGELKAYKQGELFGGLKGAEMTIGARRHQVPGNITYDRHFSGQIDEFRIWNLSRTRKQLELDMNAKLQGDEMGLLAYYPFDIYNDLGIALIPDLTDQTGLAAANAVTTGGGETNVDVPNIKDARPVQELAFDWVVNEDQIIINVNEQPSAIEKCVLEFTADRIEDMRENRMASPITWTAYIKQNSVIWNDAQLAFKKEVYDELSFDVDILNIGGTEENYTVSGMPVWLSCDAAEGSLNPDSYKTLHFTVDPVVNTGDYEFSLFLTSDFGYAEKLNISLNVSAPAPDWEVNPENYQYSMSVIGQLKIDGKLSTNPDDLVAAFVDGECRGVTNSEYIAEYDMFEVFLNIYSNQESGEKITFKIWNASEGYEHINVTPTLDFVYNDVVGTPANPQILETFNSYSFAQKLNTGWNWISFNLENSNMSDLPGIMQKVENTQGDQIKSQNAFANYSADYGWDGSLLDNGGFNNLSMYMIKQAQSDTLKYWGSKLDVNALEIPISTGWNWISYTANSNMSVADAFGNYQPANGDVVKSQFEFAMYDHGLGWLGSLTYMKPGKGYMFKTNNPPGILTYPPSGLKKTLYIDRPYETVQVSGWNLKETAFEHTMSIVGKVTDKNGLLKTDNYAIGAFAGTECRGISKPLSVDGSQLSFLTVFANTDEVIDFKLMDLDNNKLYSINEKAGFKTNKVLGSLKNPFPMTLQAASTGVNEFSQVQDCNLSVYPNPFVDNISISYAIPEKGKVLLDVYDVMGKKVTTLVSENKNAGNYLYNWNGMDSSKKPLDKGVYIIKLKTKSGNKTINVVKL